MSGPMDAWDEALRETNRADDAERDRDHHSKRADDAEAKLEVAIAEAAGRLLDEGEPVGLRAKVLDRAAKWIAIGGSATDRRDKRLSTCSALGHELLGLARFEAPAPGPAPQGLRARTVVAETERDCYRAKLIALMGVDAFEAWCAQSGLVEE